MADQVKIIIQEKNGIELPQPEEFSLIAENIPFDNTDSELTTDNVDSAIKESDSRFKGGKRFINKDVIIASTDEMLISDMIDIDINGSLEVNGLLTILGE
jgi:hypothetical protein